MTGVPRHLMLVGMPRPTALVRGALVATVALTLVACGPKGPTPPPVPIAHPGPTPARSLDPELKNAYAMIAKYASDPLVLHAVQTSKFTASYETDSLKMTATFTLDVSDGDMNLHMTDKTNGKTSKVDLIAVGTSVYAREGSAKWRKQPRAAWEQTLSDAIRDLNPIKDPAHLAYVGVETIDKQKLHHLTAVKKFPYVLADGQRGTYEKFDIWVQEDGTPVLAKGKISAIGAYGIEIKGTNELRFSKFGGKIKISAPKL